MDLDGLGIVVNVVAAGDHGQSFLTHESSQVIAAAFRAVWDWFVLRAVQDRHSEEWNVRQYFMGVSFLTQADIQRGSASRSRSIGRSRSSGRW